jgi:hypothetical protein
MSDIRTYKMPGSYKGISDLSSIYAFHGNSQGYDSCSNDVNDFIGSQGWMSVSHGFKDIDYLNQDEVNKRSLEIQKENDEYIKSLYKSGQYGEYNGDINLSLKYMPLYDDPSPIHSKGVESYRMAFIDFSKE